MANRYTGSDTGKSGLEVTEVDGAPNVRGVSKIIVSNTTLTDDGAGTVTIDTSGGGGGTPGGSNTQVQYNNAGAFAGNAGLTFADGSGTLTATIFTDGTAQLTAGALTGLTTPLTVAQGGTGASSITDGGIILGSGTAAVTATAQPADGQLLIGSGGNDPVLASMTSSASTITITGGAGTLDIDLTDTAVTPAAYTAADITVDQQGRITAAASGSAAAITATANGANDRIATYSAATELNGEANLTFSGSLLTVTGSATITTDLEIDGALNHDGTTVGFYGATPVVQGTANAYPGGTVPPGGDVIDLLVLNNELNGIAASIGSIVTLLTDLGLSA